MAYENNVDKKIVETVTKELATRYNDDDSREIVTSMQKYKSIPITVPTGNNEVGLVLEDVILLTKLKSLKNGEKVQIYELFEKNGLKILETQEDGKIKVDREIFEDLVKDKIRVIEEAGYNVAGIDKDGKIESYLELINGKVTAINKEQKERLDNAEDRNIIMDDIDIETANAEPDRNTTRNKSITDKQKQIDEQQKKEKEESEQQQQQKMNQDLGFSIFKMTKIDDPIFRMNNPQTRGKDLYAVLTHNGELRLVTKSGNHYEKAEGFKDSGNATGRTTKIVNDDDSLEDNEINTYGEIYPTNRSDVRYTAEIAPDGRIKFVEQIKYEGAKISKADEWISREVESSNTNYLDKNREGAENSKNITARTFNRASTNTDASRYGNSDGKGGVYEVGKAMKDNKPTRTTMESMAADPNQRFDKAKEMVMESYKKSNEVLSNEKEDMVDEKLKKVLDEIDEPFTEETADKVRKDVGREVAEKHRQEHKNDEHEQDSEQEEGRSRLEEELRRRMGRH